MACRALAASGLYIFKVFGIATSYMYSLKPETDGQCVYQEISSVNDNLMIPISCATVYDVV